MKLELYNQTICDGGDQLQGRTDRRQVKYKKIIKSSLIRTLENGTLKW